MTGRSPDQPRPLWQLATVLAVGLGLMLGFLALGVWQVERLAWKRDLIARVDARLAADPVDWTEIVNLPPGEQEYRPVRVTGRFDHDSEVLVKAVTEEGGGFWLLTAMQSVAGTTVLINRGFVPPDRRDPASRTQALPQGEVTVIGLARLTEPGGAFLRENDPVADRWFSRDVAAIAEARDLDRVAAFFVDADATPQPGGYPLGGLTVTRFRNAHLGYALTWFALAGLVATGLVMLIRFEIRQRGASVAR
ncbi:surfeit locus 1 family protein [Paracoccus isoporae]|uniref:SURF1-like protein n=1 Tax=Paracoccus isoporae TaxID=591205 RepID=A0A1G6UKS6_9RHOB|nr:SURF1 family protein [Paracoccus isoporae]SDD41962.1 surfeit locus 1 family protein [Paracoccus isoporae]